ncbi:MAG: hypothetical protein JST85_00060 [Acidobacteria bacterium]|nr:hypothetical protein [Acidobacteriota bacterium]
MIDFDDWLQKRMAADVEEAADLLRLALAEAEEDPRGLLVIAQAIIAAHGNLNKLNLSGAETLALSNALGRHIKVEQLRQAA